jgi:hypothetical protein
MRRRAVLTPFGAPSNEPNWYSAGSFLKAYLFDDNYSSPSLGDAPLCAALVANDAL